MGHPINHSAHAGLSAIGWVVIPPSRPVPPSPLTASVNEIPG